LKALIHRKVLKVRRVFLKWSPKLEKDLIVLKLLSCVVPGAASLRYLYRTKDGCTKCVPSYRCSTWDLWARTSATLGPRKT